MVQKLDRGLPLRFHILSFEGPDAYARAGGIASRITGLAEALAALYETHLWFVGDPGKPGQEEGAGVQLHRWCQWISQYHPGGVYDGEEGKRSDYAKSLPPYLLSTLIPHLSAGGRAVVLAEEWHTVDAVLHLDWLLRCVGLRDRVAMLWNANNTFGFERIDWNRLQGAAELTTVSRYMKYLMAPLGADALVIPNGLDADAFAEPDPLLARALREMYPDRFVITKVARWDPDKRWLGTMDIVAELKRRGLRPLLVARGGMEAHGHEVLQYAIGKGLKLADRSAAESGPRGLMAALRGAGAADVINLRSSIDPASRRLLFREVDVVLANSAHEPFGLVGLEAMAAGGVACTGCSGEDYVQPGHNALVLQTGHPTEFLGLYERLRRNPDEEHALRRAGRATALEYAWPVVVERHLLPRIYMPSVA